MKSDPNKTPACSAPVVTLHNVAIRLREQLILPETSWVICRHQNWAVVGPNGAGKTTLMRSLAGELPVVRGKITFAGGTVFRQQIAYVSFELQQRLIAREEACDAARYFSGKCNSYTTVRQLMHAADPNSDTRPVTLDPIITKLGIETLLERSIRHLSTGEMRKVLIARALLKSPQFLILDEPFEGLDRGSRAQLAEMINALMTADRQIVLVTHRLAEILPNISHVLGLRGGRIVFQGRRQEMLDSDQFKRLYHRHRSRHAFALVENHNTSLPARFCETLVEMKNTSVSYKDVVILDRLNWVMKAGENWAITGPNGAGKTTLLNLISGDHLQAYANEIYLFGRRRGTGESIWDIKKRIGMVSAEFQIRYRKPVSALDVVVSGFFDSVGLYRCGDSLQIETARQWIRFIDLADKADKPFNQLSYGEQRLLLLARAMVKRPLLLILDEPCQGLDRTNRKMILELIDAVARSRRTHILFVTHHADEIPACITHRLQFEKTQAGTYAINATGVDHNLAFAALQQKAQ